MAHGYGGGARVAVKWHLGEAAVALELEEETADKRARGGSE